jgi:hypothetical protein
VSPAPRHAMPRHVDVPMPTCFTLHPGVLHRLPHHPQHGGGRDQHVSPLCQCTSWSLAAARAAAAAMAAAPPSHPAPLRPLQLRQRGAQVALPARPGQHAAPGLVLSHRGRQRQRRSVSAHRRRQGRARPLPDQVYMGLQ